MLSIPLSALAAFHGFEHDGRDNQFDGAGRSGAGVLALDRQFGGGAGEYLIAIWRWANRPRMRRRLEGARWRCRCWRRPSPRPSSSFRSSSSMASAVILFTALALSVVLSLFASYAVAMTVVPLFCARFIHNPHLKQHTEGGHHGGTSFFQRFVRWFNHRYNRGLAHYDKAVAKSLLRPWSHGAGRTWHFSVKPCTLPIHGPLVLSAYRSGAIRYQRQGAQRHAD